MINLILGEKVLPYHTLSSTSTICELRYGEQRRIVIHFRDGDPETGLTTKSVILNDPKESSQDSYIEQITRYVFMKNDREEGPAYQKIELFWPHSLLEVCR